MNVQSPGLTSLAPPRGAAIAGVIFALLMIAGLALVRYAIPANVNAPGSWLIDPNRTDIVRLALDLVPFSGIAFLWFIGVMRYRVAAFQDRFFETVFVGSGLIFVAILFAAAAMTDALIQSVAAGNIHGDIYYFGRRTTDVLLNLFAMKMAAVFMFSTCTVGLRTAIFPRWVAYVGYACGVTLLVIVANWKWITLVFPLWMLVMSTRMLLAEFRFPVAKGRRTPGAMNQSG
jgi:hypothetical protein